MAIDLLFGAAPASLLPPDASQMDVFWRFLGEIGAPLAWLLASIGSALGVGAAAQAAAGAWAKEARAGRQLRFAYVILLGMPISQTLYAMIVMNNMRSAYGTFETSVADAGLLFGIGVATGIGEMLSAWIQGMIGAGGVRMLSDGGGKGFAYIIIAMGVVETVGIFTMVFLLGMIPGS